MSGSISRHAEFASSAVGNSKSSFPSLSLIAFHLPFWVVERIGFQRTNPLLNDLLLSGLQSGKKGNTVLRNLIVITPSGQPYLTFALSLSYRSV
jgi:hypothetical protein